MRLRDILFLPGHPATPGLRSAIDVVDALHAFPSLPRFPVVWTRHRREQGAYYGQDRPHHPIKITISSHAAHPALTLLHEVGHLLDHIALNPLKRGFGSDYDALFAPLLRAWSESMNVRALDTLLRKHGHQAASQDRSAMRVQLSACELWARTYAQWVVMTSGSVSLRQDLTSLRQTGSHFAGRLCAFQWDDADFIPIMKRTDELLREAGLR